MKKTLIIIGDPMMNSSRLEPSLDRFMNYRHLLRKRGIEVVFIAYEDVTSLRLPDMKSARVYVLLFFPYNHWNSHIERYDKDSRIYGDISFGRDYNIYLEKIGRIIKKKYKNKDLRFINPPESCIIDRDKSRTFNVLKRAGIKTPDILKVKTVEMFDKMLNRYGSLYVKPRFGAMGKGITYADTSGIYTNFCFRSNKIINRLYDYNWRPVKVSRKNQRAFITALISRGFIFQRAVNPLACKGRRFDIRVYAVCGKTPYIYAKSMPVSSFITNWSQGGRIEDRLFLNRALSAREIKAVKSISLKAAKAINLSFAGVDIIIDRDTRGINVLEIQSFPGYERGFDLMKFLAVNI